MVAQMGRAIPHGSAIVMIRRIKHGRSSRLYIMTELAPTIVSILRIKMPNRCGGMAVGCIIIRRDAFHWHPKAFATNDAPFIHISWINDL
jgi:hypothetical protein